MSINGNKSELRYGSGLRARPDLRAVPARYRGQEYWTLQDPATLRVYQLRDDEHFVMQQLDGTVGVREIKQRFERERAPRVLPITELQSFINRLQREGLLVSGSLGQSRSLLERGKQLRRHAFWARSSNLLAIRLPGIDPEPCLNWLLPKVRWMFSSLCLVLFALSVIMASCIAIWQFGVLGDRLPQLSSLWNRQAMLMIVIAIAVSKALHELGHALTCKYLGGTCREMGVMLLVFTPCLYCDVSEAWMLPNKWHRIAISVAGIVVELALASLCLFVWFWSEPGLVHQLCLSVFVVCSVNTLLINGNPLLRFDGYYVFSDWLEIPNLQQRAWQAVSNVLGPAAVGAESNANVDSQAPLGLLFGYGLAAIAYRVLVVLGILWMIHQTLEPMGLAVLAQLITFSVALTFIVPMATRATRSALDPRQRSLRRFRRPLAAIVVSTIVIAGFLLIPLPYRATVPVIIEPSDVEHVYVTVEGRLLNAKRPGEIVSAGDELGRMENLEVAREFAILKAKSDQQASYVDQLKRLQGVDPTANESLPTAEAVSRDLLEQLEQKQRELSKLRLVAHRAGTIVPPLQHNEVPELGQLRTWQGTPLDPQNQHAHLTVGTLFCSVGNPDELDAVATVDQSVINRITPGQAVRLRFGALPGKIIRGHVSEIGERPQTTHARARTYEVKITLDQTGAPLRLGAAGQARISLPSESIARRIYRAFRGTFVM